ncbi:Fic family protein [Deinococcus radiophilus]|uniref:Fic family protein n=1 Tax=Deinococcus radiophilus TaxID=32062 RepID=UPI00361572AD
MTGAESQHLEWKESWRDEYLKWICAFANSGGGTLVVGRGDSGRAVGVADPQRLLEDLPNKIRNLLGLVVPVQLRHEEGHALIEIHVEASPYPVSYRGKYYSRSGSTTQELSGAALDAFLLRMQGRHWDSVPVPRVGPAHLSDKALARFRTLAARSGRVETEWLEESDTVLLERLRLVEGDYLKRAAILLFHPDPEQFIGGAFVKIGAFGDSDADLRFQDEVHGPLILQVERTVEVLKAKYLKALISYQGLQRIESLQVPEAALREAVLNAVVHKDYSSSVPIQISVYPGRLLIFNPGQLPQGWTLEKLLGKHASLPFNPDIANAFFRAGQIESWGRGIERVREVCRAAGATEPQWKAEPTELWVEFELLQEQIGRVPPKSPPSHPQVKLLMTLGERTLSRQKLQEELGLKDTQYFRQSYLLPALEAGLIEMTIPDKPTSRLQKYRLTEQGRAALGQQGDLP